MKRFLLFLLCASLLCGCSTVDARKNEQAAAYASLSAKDRDLVRQKRIERGMDTNAVYIALGKPSRVIAHPQEPGVESDLTWLYYGNEPVLVPRWTYLPDAYGYWTLQYTPAHYSKPYLKTQVRFKQGRVLDWKTY